MAKLESFFNSSRARLKIKRRQKSTTRTSPCLSADGSGQRRGRHDAAPKNKQKATVYLSRCFLRDQPDGLLPCSAPVPCAHFHCVTAPGIAVPPRRRGPFTKVSRNLAHGPTAPRSPSPTPPRRRRFSLGPSHKTSPPFASSSVAAFHPVPSPNRNWKSGGRGPPTESAEEPEPGLGCGPGRSRATERPAAGRRGSGLKGGGRAGGRTRPPGRRGGSCRQPPPPRPPPRLLPVR